MSYIADRQYKIRIRINIWARNIVVFTAHDEHSQGEHPHDDDYFIMKNEK